MFSFLKYKRTDPYKYKMLCRTCDIFFEVESPERKICPCCGQHERTELYSLIDKKTEKTIL